MYNPCMNVTLTIPDEMAVRLGAGGIDLSRRALEALAAEEFQAGRLTKPDLRKLFGFQTGYEIDGFLKAHDVYEDFTMADLKRDIQDFYQAGL